MTVDSDLDVAHESLDLDEPYPLKKVEETNLVPGRIQPTLTNGDDGNTDVGQLTKSKSIYCNLFYVYTNN